MSWFSRVDDLLYDGETVEERVPVGAGGVVVTSHRVLAFTPGDEGSNFEYVERPNVVGIERRSRGNTPLLAHAVKALVVGVVLVAVGQFFSLDGLVGTIDLSGSGGVGLGGVLGMVQTLLNVLAMLDEILQLLGALALLVGVALLGLYGRSRENVLVVEVAGGENIELPVADEEDVVGRLDRAIRPDGPGGTNADRTAGPR